MAERKTKKITEQKIHALGRRKTSICTINLLQGEGENTVNGKKLEQYFPMQEQKATIMKAFVLTDTLGDFYFTARVSGGGSIGQADALQLAIARSLIKRNPELLSVLSKAGLLTRDPRAKERKKIFFVRARKRPQYSKR